MLNCFFRCIMTAGLSYFFMTLGDFQMVKGRLQCKLFPPPFSLAESEAWIDAFIGSVLASHRSEFGGRWGWRRLPLKQRLSISRMLNCVRIY